MPYLTNLVEVAKRTGYPVVAVSGWKTRGHGPQPDVQGIVCHHTAGWNDMHIVRDGRPGLDGPLSQFWLRKDGTIFVVAAGRCWHNAPSTSPLHTNSNSIGIEAENDGRAPWPDVQVDAYLRLCAELCKEFGLTAARVKGHKEVQPGKPDPHTLNMNTFRTEVARLMTETAKPLFTWTETLMEDLPLLREGADSYDVKTVRALLVARGGNPEELDLLNTRFSPELAAQVKAFQKSKKLDDDGIVGRATWTALLRQSAK